MQITPLQLRELEWQESCLLWAVDNKIKQEKGELLEFKNHRFLKDIFDDWTPVQTFRKSSQVIGLSTTKIIKSYYAAKYKKLNQIYSLPTFNDINQFVPSKVNPMISNNPILAEWTKDKDTTFQKKVGDRFIFYRGASSGKIQKEAMESGTGITLTSDLNIYDESDRSDQAILEQYDSRLEASDYKGRWYFSNPTHPGTPTQQLWDKSDQKHWFVECPHCGELQYLDYFKNVDKEKEIFICIKCHKEIDNDTRRNGFWVKKYRERKISGYWLPHMISPLVSAKQMIETENTKSKQYFYNFCLGLPYRGSDVIVDSQIILQNIVYGEPNYKTQNVIGVDTGLTMHYVLGNKQGIFKIGSTKNWDDIEFLMKKYDATAVFDALGDLTKPRQLRDKYRGKVWLCFTKKDKDSPESIKWKPEEMAVYMDRSKTIQMVIDEFVDGKIKFYETRPEDLKTYIEHWGTLSQKEETDSIKVTRKVWDTDGENHYLFATIYFYLALNKATSGQGVDWKLPLKTADYYAQTPNPKEIVEEMENFESDDWRA